MVMTTYSASGERPRTAELAELVASRRDMNTQIPKMVVGGEGGRRIVAEQVKTTELAHLQSVLITLIVAVIVVMNATILSIYERVREVGIMGAMGSEVWHIMDMYVFELLIIGFIGGVGGYLAGTLISLATRVLPGIPNIALKVNPLWIMASVSIGALVSVAAGVFPARLAGTLDPIKAIAGEWAISPTEGRIFGTISRAAKRSYYAAMAARNLGKRKLRSVLTSLGITVGIAMLVNLLVISAFQRQITPGYSIQVYQLQVVFFAILVGALGITNAMLTSVLERTKEIGIMVAVGATPGEVMKVFLSEAGIIGIMGGGLGCILGTATSLMFFAGREGLVLPLQSIALGWVSGIILAVVVAVAAGRYPSRRAARMEPVEAFMYEW
jgi:ABC-type antimicrobial peptide transport system permease subunit